MWLLGGVCEEWVRGWVGSVWLVGKEESGVVWSTVGGRLFGCGQSELKCPGAVPKVPWQNKNQREREFLETGENLHNENFSKMKKMYKTRIAQRSRQKKKVGKNQQNQEQNQWNKNIAQTGELGPKAHTLFHCLLSGGP